MARIKCPKCRSVILVRNAPHHMMVTCSHCGEQIAVMADEPPDEALDEQAAGPVRPDGELDALDGMTDSADEPLDAEVVENVISPQDRMVLAELEWLQNQQPGWGGALPLLVISVLLFTSLGKGGQAWGSLVTLMAVLAFHELGHYAAMRHFGYRNLRMFFIPFFGAAVSGRHYNIAGWKKALVALAGPVPGILVGALFGAASLMLDEPKLADAAVLMLILNGFNLLPFLPLDGGWIVHAVLFVRHPVLDVVFRVVAAVGLIALSLAMGNWVLIIVGVVMLLAVPLVWRLAHVAHRLKEEGLMAISGDADSIPVDTALTILAAVRTTAPPQTPPRVLASNVINVFETLNATPPGAAASIGLLAIHTISFVAALLVSGLILVMQHRPA